jgi:hypothetical protein
MRGMFGATRRQSHRARDENTFVTHYCIRLVGVALIMHIPYIIQDSGRSKFISIYMEKVPARWKNNSISFYEIYNYFYFVFIALKLELQFYIVIPPLLDNHALNASAFFSF